MAGWELREHLHHPVTVSHVFCNFAFQNTEFDLRWEPSERRHGAPLGLNPVLQAAERFVDDGIKIWVSSYDFSFLLAACGYFSSLVEQFKRETALGGNGLCTCS